MSESCCSSTPRRHENPADGRERRSQRRILWIALVVNATMFLLELLAGAHARSSSLQADALDFLADAANYAISLFVVAASLRRRATAALVKGASMGLLGLWVLSQTVYQVLTGTVPRAEVMGVVGLLALLANGGVLALLLSFRRGDSNMRSVWICSRNDAIGNVAVLLAASGVFATGTSWPDILVALAMATLSLSGAAQILTHATQELRGTRAPQSRARARGSGARPTTT